MVERQAPEVLVTVKMNPLELKLFRRALAVAADDKLLDRTEALSRICELDNLRWTAEERRNRAQRPVNSGQRKTRSLPLDLASRPIRRRGGYC